MGNFKVMVRIRETGEFIEAVALDGYFGGGEFGYSVVTDSGEAVYRESEVAVYR